MADDTDIRRTGVFCRVTTAHAAVDRVVTATTFRHTPTCRSVRVRLPQGDQSPGNRIGLGLRQHLLRTLDALAEAALELCILLPGLDVLGDRGTHDLGNRHGVHASNRFQLLGLLLSEANGHRFRGLHGHQYCIAVTRFAITAVV